MPSRRIILFLIVPLLAGLAVSIWFPGPGATAKDWRTASREPVGLAPDPALTPEAVVQVYGARAVRWRGYFGVHTWVAAKPAGARAWTVYEVIGWRLRHSDSAVVIHGRPPTAIGKDFNGGRLIGRAPSGSGLQLSLFGLLGVTASAVEGFEINVLGLTFRINPFDPAVKLPLVGRIGPAR